MIKKELIKIIDIAVKENRTTLDLRDYQLKELPQEIGRLTNLTHLYLSNNLLKELPSEIAQLTDLKKLYLGNNHLKELPSEIAQLTELTELYLGNNLIKELPSEIDGLTNLTKLYLDNNKLIELPSEISKLTNLTELYLGNNLIKELPSKIIHLNNLKWVDFTNNPIETPPIEIVEMGIASIKDYFRQLIAEEKDYIYEAKLLIVGEAGAGKTTLAKKIENQNYQLKEEITTKGIDVIQWKFPIDKGREFRVNIWDFGGQEIYLTTHQFFLTKRSLYVLVADTRKEDTDFQYWCNIVSLLGDNSPMLVVKNEKQNRRREINESQLRGQFSNLKETFATNLATNRGLTEIINNIKHYINTLPHIGSALPKTWVKVRKQLENNHHRNSISFEKYLNICEDNGFKQRKDVLQLSSYLHDLGVCLHFQEDPVLKKTVIVNPEWGTDAVYKVLDNDGVKNKHGVFTKSDLEKIWKADKYADMQDELLQLMINFQLCYEIPGTIGNYIAPQLLTDNQPNYDWDETRNLILRYEYEFMPKGIITRFIVVMHSMIADKNLVWKNGVILENEDTSAEIIEYYEKREIRIRINGKSKRDLLVITTYELDKINNSFHQLKYNKMIPCNCVTCKYSQEPHFYLLTDLISFRENIESEIQCRKPPYQMVKVSNLIDDVTDKKDMGRSQSDVVEWKTEFHYHEGNKRRDTYEIHGQAGAVGSGAHASEINFTQIWKELRNDIDLNKLSEELAEIRTESSKLAQSPERLIVTGEIASAEIAAKEGNGAKMLDHLKKAGKWALDVSTNIGTNITTELIKKSMGI